MFALVVIVTLVATVVLGTILGRRYRVGPPVLLIMLGALLGLIPRFSAVHIDGGLVLLLFLPAILYWESMNTSFREIRANLRVIAMFSIGLVDRSRGSRGLDSNERSGWSRTPQRCWAPCFPPPMPPP